MAGHCHALQDRHKGPCGSWLLHLLAGLDMPDEEGLPGELKPALHAMNKAEYL